MIAERNEIEEKIQALYPRFVREMPSQTKQQIVNSYFNKIENDYRGTPSYPNYIKYTDLTELDKLKYIDQKIYVDEQVLVLVEDPGKGTKFSVMMNLVFNDFVKYRDREFFEKYKLLFEYY